MEKLSKVNNSKKMKDKFELNKNCCIIESSSNYEIKHSRSERKLEKSRKIKKILKNTIVGHSVSKKLGYNKSVHFEVESEIIDEIKNGKSHSYESEKKLNKKRTYNNSKDFKSHNIIKDENQVKENSIQPIISGGILKNSVAKVENFLYKNNLINMEVDAENNSNKDKKKKKDKKSRNNLINKEVDAENNSNKDKKKDKKSRNNLINKEVDAENNSNKDKKKKKDKKSRNIKKNTLKNLEVNCKTKDLEIQSQSSLRKIKKNKEEDDKHKRSIKMVTKPSKNDLDISVQSSLSKKITNKNVHVQKNASKEVKKEKIFEMTITPELHIKKRKKSPIKKDNLMGEHSKIEKYSSVILNKINESKKRKRKNNKEAVNKKNKSGDDKIRNFNKYKNFEVPIKKYWSNHFYSKQKDEFKITGENKLGKFNVTSSNFRTEIVKDINNNDVDYISNHSGFFSSKCWENKIEEDRNDNSFEHFSNNLSHKISSLDAESHAMGHDPDPQSTSLHLTINEEEKFGSHLNIKSNSFEKNLKTPRNDSVITLSGNSSINGDTVSNTSEVTHIQHTYQDCSLENKLSKTICYETSSNGSNSISDFDSDFDKFFQDLSWNDSFEVSNQTKCKSFNVNSSSRMQSNSVNKNICNQSSLNENTDINNFDTDGNKNFEDFTSNFFSSEDSFHFTKEKKKLFYSTSNPNRNNKGKFYSQFDYKGHENFHNSIMKNAGNSDDVCNKPLQRDFAQSNNDVDSNMDKITILGSVGSPVTNSKNSSSATSKPNNISMAKYTKPLNECEVNRKKEFVFKCDDQEEHNCTTQATTSQTFKSENNEQGDFSSQDNDNICIRPKPILLKSSSSKYLSNNETEKMNLIVTDDQIRILKSEYDLVYGLFPIPLNLDGKQKLIVTQILDLTSEDRLIFDKKYLLSKADNVNLNSSTSSYPSRIDSPRKKEHVELESEKLGSKSRENSEINIHSEDLNSPNSSSAESNPKPLVHVFGKSNMDLKSRENSEINIHLEEDLSSPNSSFAESNPKPLVHVFGKSNMDLKSRENSEINIHSEEELNSPNSSSAESNPKPLVHIFGKSNFPYKFELVKDSNSPINYKQTKIDEYIKPINRKDRKKFPNPLCFQF